jgi:hypothetical protein
MIVSINNLIVLGAIKVRQKTYMNTKHWIIFPLEIGEIVGKNRSYFLGIRKPTAS